MFSRMMQLVNTSDNLYLAPPQQKEVLDYAKSLGTRFDVARKVEKAEKAILDSATKTLQENCLELNDLNDSGWTNHATDLQFVLRTIVQGMLMNDEDFAHRAAVDSLAREFSFLDFPDTTVTEVLSSLRQAVEEHLPPSAAETILPYFEPAFVAA